METNEEENMSNDALLHKMQEENDKLRRERTSYKLDKEAYKGTIDKIKKEMRWFENFAGAMYSLDKDMYDKASKVAYEMLKKQKEE